MNHRAFHKRDHSCADDFYRVDTSRLHANCIIKLETFKALHHEHTPSNEARMWTRHDVSVLMQLVQHLGNIKHVVGFDAKVEFFDNRLGKKFNQCGWVGKCTDLDATNHVGGKPRHDSQIFTYEIRNRWSLYFDNYFLAGDQRG